MSWGTQFNTEIFISRLSIKTVGDVEDAILESEAIIKIFEQELLILASLNNFPYKERTLEDVIFNIRTAVNEALDGIKEQTLLLGKLQILKEHLKDGGEVENV